MVMGMMSAGAMGGGVSSSVARALGAKRQDRANAAAGHAVVIALLMATLFAVVFVGFGRGIFALFGGRGAALEGAVGYARTLFLGGYIVWLTNTLASILRGTGDLRTPSLALLAAAFVHVPLSGALTLGWGGVPRLGVMGPAVAMVVTALGAGVWMALRLASGSAAVRLQLQGAGLRWEAFRDILRVGGIACLVVILTNATILVVTGLIGRAGNAALAGYGTGSRLEYMLIPISFGVGAALTAMVGTNVGARQYARAQRIAWTGAGMAAVVAGVIGLTVAVAPDLWLRIFTQDAAVLEQGRTYLRIVGPVYGLFGLAMALYFASQGTGTMLWPVFANLCRISVAVGGGLFSLSVLGLGARGLYACVALGITAFSAILAYSTTTRAWRPDRA
jgi:putative MATE family efflux protein